MKRFLSALFQRASFLFPFLFSGLALWVFFSTETTIWRTHYPSLFWDQWDIYASLRNYTDSGQFWTWLFLSHNGHRFVVARLLWLQDLYGFGGTNISLLLLMQLNQVVIIGTFAALAWKHLNSNQLRIWVIAISTLLLFSATQLENFTWSLQIQFVNVFLFALLSFYFADRFVKTNESVFMWATCLFAVLSSFSMANGVLVWLLLGFLGWVHRRRWMGIVFTLVFILTVLIYFPHSGTGKSFSLQSIGEKLVPDLTFLKFLLIYIANPLGKKSFALAYIHGSLSLGLFIVFVFHHLGNLFRERKYQSGAPLLQIAAFTVLTALSTTMGRVDRGLINATAERYTTAALILTAALIVYLSIHWRRLFSHRFTLAFISIWMLSSLVYIWVIVQYQPFYCFHFGIQSQRKWIALDAIRNECMDPNYAGYLYPDLSRHLHAVKDLRSQSQTRSTHTLQTEGYRFSENPGLITKFLKLEAMQCDDLDGNPSKLIVYGSISIRSAWLNGELILTDESRHILGSGMLIKAFPYEEPFIRFDPENGNLFLYCHADDDLIGHELQLWLRRGKTLYLLGHQGTPPVSKLKRAKLQPLSTMIGLPVAIDVLERDTGWTEGGIYPGIKVPDFLHDVWGSWSGSDANTGSILLRLGLKSGSRHLLIPYLSGPSSPAAKIILKSADTHQRLAEYVLSPSPEIWKWIRIPVPFSDRQLELEIEELGSDWGQWIGIAAPFEE